MTAQTQFPIPKMMLFYATSEQASSVAPVLMESNHAQTVEDREGDLRGLYFRCWVDRGCYRPISRVVPLLAEELTAELFDQCACFHNHAARLNFLRPNSPNRCTSSVAS